MPRIRDCELGIFLLRWRIKEVVLVLLRNLQPGILSAEVSGNGLSALIIRGRALTPLVQAKRKRTEFIKEFRNGRSKSFYKF